MRLRLWAWPVPVRSSQKLVAMRVRVEYVYIIAWLAVVLGTNSTSIAGSNFHEAKPSEISCITSAINP